MVILQVSTVSGKTLEVSASPMVKNICAELESKFHFRRGVKLMQQGKVLDTDSTVDVGLPIVAIGTTVQSGATRSPSISPSRHPRTDSDFTVNVLLVAQNKQHRLHLHSDSTVGDLVAALLSKEPTTHSCRLVFCGHELDDASKPLRHFGVRSDSMVHVVSKALSPNGVRLLEAQKTLDNFLQQKQGDLAEQAKKALYEQSMKLLFSLDGMEDLSEDERPMRKELVRQIQAFQDSLLGSHSTN